MSNEFIVFQLFHSRLQGRLNIDTKAALYISHSFKMKLLTIKQKASIFLKCKVSVGMLFLTFVTKRLACDFMWYMNQLMHLCIYSRIISSKLFPAYITFLANAQKNFGHLAVSCQWQLAVFYGIPYNRHFTLEKNWNILCCYKYGKYKLITELCIGIHQCIWKI